MKNNKKDEYVKYSKIRPIRLTQQQQRLVDEKAAEQNTTASDIIRQAVMQYVNRAMSDTEIVHASLSENTRKLRYLENKVELLALIVFQQTKFLMRIMPSRQVNSDALVESDFERFRRDCLKSLKSNHGGMLEAMILDLYEQGGNDQGGD